MSEREDVFVKHVTLAELFEDSNKRWGDSLFVFIRTSSTIQKWNVVTQLCDVSFSMWGKYEFAGFAIRSGEIVIVKMCRMCERCVVHALVWKWWDGSISNGLTKEIATGDRLCFTCINWCRFVLKSTYLVRYHKLFISPRDTIGNLHGIWNLSKRHRCHVLIHWYKMPYKVVIFVKKYFMNHFFIGHYLEIDGCRGWLGVCTFSLQRSSYLNEGKQWWSLETSTGMKCVCEKNMLDQKEVLRRSMKYSWE